MIERYSRPEMTQLWTPQARFEAWLTIELAVCEVYHAQGKLTPKEWEALQKASFSLERIEELERITRHDVVAFTRAVSETLGDEKRWIHYGLTSTDVVDTANGYIFKQVNAILKKDILQLRSALVEMALRYQHTPIIGRTHGVHAEITSFGLKFALWIDELDRQLERFESASKEIEVGKISGAVGNHLYTGVQLQDEVCRLLGLTSAKISTQVLQRDRHAYYLSVIALIGSTLDKIATEMRHLQRTEVREVEEGFKAGQKGSSAMPHKRNPISFENISGLSRVLRGYLTPAYEDIALWHERDISHSSVERIILPDATILLDYMLHRMTGLIQNLTVFEDRMEENIHLTHGVIFAQRVMNVLIDEKGMSREEAYDLIQPIAMKAWEERCEFKKLCLDQPSLMTRLSPSELEVCFDLDFYLKEVDAIYQRLHIQ